MGIIQLKQRLVIAACLFVGALNSACNAAPGNVVQTKENRHPPTKAAESSVTNQALPINRQFRNLDEYLAHLERQSHVGGKSYKQIKPGLYELQTGNLHLDTPSGEKRIYTREELEKKFGFSK
jgi:hypothetical protein